MRFETPESAMQYALSLARRGVGFVEPNPAVGAVIVSPAGELLGEGWHQKYGGPHAEVHALAMAGAQARGATVYTTLEPCSHFGKTPPCADALIAAGIQHVETAIVDPAAHVAGQGIARLREAGITVNVGLEFEAAQVLVAPFVKSQLTKKPWIHAKWAMTLDGKIASRIGHSQWISSPDSRQEVHELRGRVDAILVGMGTVMSDDPRLTVRLPSNYTGPQRQPARVVLDSRLSIDMHTELVQTAHKVPTILVTVDPQNLLEGEREREWLLRKERLEAVGCIVWPLPASDGDVGHCHHPCLESLLLKMGEEGWSHVLVEGGARVLGSFFDADLVDEVHVYIGPKLVGGSAASSPVEGKGRLQISNEHEFCHSEFRLLGCDAAFHGVRRIAIEKLNWLNDPTP